MENKENKDKAPEQTGKKESRSGNQRFIVLLGNFALWFFIGYVVIKLLTGQ